MSSTGRGTVREVHDAYHTKYPLALAICQQLKKDGIEAMSILEPSAGRGSFVSAAAEVWRPQRIVCVDIDTTLLLPEHRDRAQRNADAVHVVPADCLGPGNLTPGTYDLVLGNPPFSDAEAHIRHALTLLGPKGTLAFLLRLNFLASIRRTAGLWTEHPPEYVYVLDKRPSFTDDGRSDSTEYMVAVWKKERPEFEPTLRWLAWSPMLDKFKHTVERTEIVRGAELDRGAEHVAGSVP